MDFLSEQFRKRPLAEWDEYLATLDICYGRVNTPREALSHPHLNKRGMIVSDGQGRTHIAPPIHFRNEPASPAYLEPQLGEQNDTILKGA